MADDIKEDLIEIRSFSTMEEIRMLPGFREDNPVAKHNYDRIVGDYLLSDEVKCCREKSKGKLCGEGHKYGFVARLNDKTFSIVGNYCAQDKFGADAKIKTDRNKYLNEKTRRERLAKLANILLEKETKLSQIGVLGSRLKKTQECVRVFLESLGPRTARKLTDMGRTSNAVILVNAITYKNYLDEDGITRNEKSVSPTKLGNLSGLSVINERLFQTLYLSMNSIKQAFKEAEAIFTDIKTSQLASLINTINDLDQIEKEVSGIEKEEEAFFSNELWLLCFLVDDKAERYKAARTVLGQLGEGVGKDKAKDWLIEKDQEVKKNLNADKIEIP